MQKWLDLEWSLHRFFKKRGLENKRLLVALSGGLDSQSLGAALIEIASSLKLELVLRHVVHGQASTPATEHYRAQVQDFLEEFYQGSSLNFKVLGSSQEAVSQTEAGLREYRYALLQAERLRTDSHFLVLAHHADDLLETRLIRLIRGTGFQGLEAMKSVDVQKRILRPLLEASRTELESYADSRSLSYIEDPSNEDDTYLRNWLRNDWLPQLEAYRPGALKAMSRSLGQISLTTEKKQRELKLDYYLEEGRLKRPLLLSLARPEVKNLIALYFKRLDLKNYSHFHVEEIIKRLDSAEKLHRFKLLGRNWVINAQHVYSLPLV